MFSEAMRGLILSSIFLLSFSCNKGPNKNPVPQPTPGPSPVPQPARFDINANLVTPNPTKEAVALYQFLKDNYGRKLFQV